MAGRKSINETAMTAAERKKRSREMAKKKATDIANMSQNCHEIQETNNSRFEYELCEIKKELEIAKAEIQFLRAKKPKINGNCANCYFMSFGTGTCFQHKFKVNSTDVCELFITPNDYLRQKSS